MTKGIKILLAAFVLSLGVMSCNSDASDNTNISKPIDGVDQTANDKKSKTPSLSADKTKEEKSRKNALDQKNAKKKKEAQKTLSADRVKSAIEFNDIEHHFGTIDEGDKVEHVFKFTNTGNEPLILEKCKGSCGCTVPTCPKDPIPPGGTGEIKVVFNSKGKKNHQEKRVTITANTDPIQTVLKIIADVTPEVKEEAK